MSPRSGESDWHFPAPHEVLAFLFLVATAAQMTDLFAPESVGHRILTLVMAVFALSGVASARNYVSPRLRAVLDERDRVVSKALDEPPKEEQPK